MGRMVEEDDNVSSDPVSPILFIYDYTAHHGQSEGGRFGRIGECK